jgi:hypothetical protein
MAEQYGGYTVAPCAPPYGRQSPYERHARRLYNMPERPSACDVTDPIVQQAESHRNFHRRSVCRLDGSAILYDAFDDDSQRRSKGFRVLCGDVMKTTVKTQHGF